MNDNYWLQKWQTNNIAFHKTKTNPVLVQHFKQLTLAKENRVFVPLCGKTLDIAWLLANGYRVAGAELVELAIEQLFAELNVEPTIVDLGQSKHYSAANIDIFVGDILQLSGELLGPVDAVYDRAALVALPETVRRHYASHLVEITGKAPQLLVSFDYDQTVMSGPPFSVNQAEVHQHYGKQYQIALLQSSEIPGGLKGKCVAKENVWLLTTKH